MSFETPTAAVNHGLSIRVLMQGSRSEADCRVADMLSSMGIDEIRILVAEMEAELNGPEARIAWALRPLLDIESDRSS